MKKLITIILCICSFSVEMKSQTTLESVQKMEITNFPFQLTCPSPVIYDVTELAKKIPINNSYRDINATVKDNTMDDTEILMDYRFPNQDGKYYFLVRSRYTDSSLSDYLILMNPDGTISDYLWVGLFFPTRESITTINFKIDASGIITVSQIKSYPNSNIVSPYDRNITSFTGQRTDKNYQVVNGKFVLKSTKSYQPIIYKYSINNKSQHEALPT